jgi:hypothetical protein
MAATTSEAIAMGMAQREISRGSAVRPFCLSVELIRATPAAPKKRFWPKKFP